MAKLEICCFDIETTILAANSGADRIELCLDYASGGLTPPLFWIEKIQQKTEVPLYCMIRPRPGDFKYSPDEFQTMKKEIRERREMGIRGFVFGILDENLDPDMPRLQELMELAFPLPVTFHRAFDWVRNPLNALDELITAGFERILSSGQRKSAWEGRELLKELIRVSSGRIAIMPGAGIRSESLEALNQYLKAEEYHSSALSPNIPFHKESYNREIGKMKKILE